MNKKIRTTIFVVMLIISICAVFFAIKEAYNQSLPPEFPELSDFDWNKPRKLSKEEEDREQLERDVKNWHRQIEWLNKHCK